MQADTADYLQCETCHIWHGKMRITALACLQAYPPIFSLTPKASGSTRLQSCEDKVFNSQIIFYKKDPFQA